MLRAVSSLCPFCEVRSLFPRTAPSQWQQTRLASQMRSRTPSRMALSPKVAQSGKPAPRRRVEGPFAGLNRTTVPRIPGRPMEQSDSRGRDFKGRETPSNLQKRNNRSGRPERRDSGDYHALKMQRALHPVSYTQRSSIKERIREMDSFDSFPLLPVIKESISTQALPGLDDISPTPAQRVTIPAMLGMDQKKSKHQVAGMQQFLLAAETGSGKTLAYLLPIMDAIKRQEVVDREKAEKKKAKEEEERSKRMFELESPPLAGEEHPDAGRPRAIILLPSAELVAQVGAVVKSFSHTVKFKASLISAAFSGNVIRNRLFAPSGVDIVIATPHLLSSIAESDPNILSRVTHIVVDEADSLLDRSFSPLTTNIIDRASPTLKQLILCSATIPRSMDSYLEKRFPDIKRLVTPNLHAIPRRVQLGVVDTSQPPYKGNKDLACADTIWNIGRQATEYYEDGQETVPTKRIIVFVNEREKTIELANYLVSKGVDAVALNRDTINERSSHLLAAFQGVAGAEDKDGKAKAKTDAPAAAPASDPNQGRKGPAARSLANTKVLVTTDLGSRGIDTVAVRHVILYDVPHTTIDFIHRLGRTGRMGRRGRGIVLLGKGDRADVVKEVREGMFKGQALI
ncbi:uncharacterized protein K452DRAFT_223390 [Aplosporella prunicola CBS 121167]|uniref:RNA helicase n=1 Tax=Aplosporella prunicola CBS 121167 TaxID=1176127 RepID=A0A6A6BL84_9PEZI|nr:uncharacterized protein K452DRAFT_223390 [Aplosporella prunicola CBS 121167]KAF2144143.1 hypothetical protein K452DRAFT_223390 [Aplosporella prunicola CBS 121167]